MTPEDLSTLHAAAFTMPRPWSAKEFADLLASPLVFVIVTGPAFAMGRVIAGEAELLTIATDPAQQRQGHGRAALIAFETEARARGGETAFLEVAATNPGALALYLSNGWQLTGRRPGYYHAPDGSLVDAQILGKSLT